VQHGWHFENALQKSNGSPLALESLQLWFSGRSFKRCCLKSKSHRCGTPIGDAAAGIVGFVATRLGQRSRKSIQRTTMDLQAQFAAVQQGNFNAKPQFYLKMNLVN